jgi:hypothetical protein
VAVHLDANVVAAVLASVVLAFKRIKEDVAIGLRGIGRSGRDDHALLGADAGDGKKTEYGEEKERTSEGKALGGIADS